MLKKISFVAMNPMKSVSVAALAIALAGGLAVQTAWADLPNTPANVKVMDQSKDGKIQKSEYLAFMGAQFDKQAGNKGYCTFDEISAGLKKMGSAFPESYGNSD